MCEFEVLLKEGLNGADVLPVVLEQVSNHLQAFRGCPWDDLTTEIIVLPAAVAATQQPSVFENVLTDN